MSDKQQGKEEDVDALLQAIRNEPFNPWKAMDETGFKLGDRTRYDYSKRGKHAVATKMLSPCNYSLLLCISFIGRCVWKLIKGAANAISFQKFLQDDVGQVFPNANLVLDNVPFHHATDSLRRQWLPTIKQTAYNLGIKLHYTVPYCPFLNPSEYVFSMIKSTLRREIPKTESELRTVISDAVISITPRKSHRLFEHCFQRSRIAPVTTR